MPSMLMRRTAADVTSTSGSRNEPPPAVMTFLVGTMLGALLGVGAGVVSQRLLDARSAATSPAPPVEHPRFEALLQ